MYHSNLNNHMTTTCHRLFDLSLPGDEVLIGNKMVGMVIMGLITPPGDIVLGSRGIFRRESHTGGIWSL